MPHFSIKLLKEELGDTSKKISNDIKKDFFYLYYGSQILGISLILSFILLFTVFPDSQIFEQFLGLLLASYLIITSYEFYVTKDYYFR